MTFNQKKLILEIISLIWKAINQGKNVDFPGKAFLFVDESLQN
jgi:hypothetical protein